MDEDQPETPVEEETKVVLKADAYMPPIVLLGQIGDVM
jgi:hypothetical protein